MADSKTIAHDVSVDEAVREIKSERARRSWIAAVLFMLSGTALFTGFYFSYRDVPAPPNPGNATPALLAPYR